MLNEPWYRRLIREPHCTACQCRGSSALCAHCVGDLERLACRAPLAVRPFAYQSPLSQLLARFKYQGELTLLPALEQLLSDLVADLNDIPDGVCALPLHWRRHLRRGFNQSVLLARHVSREIGIPLHARWLAKPRATRAQVGLDAADRLTNVAGSFRARPACTGRHVLLVDDIMTTGASLRAARDALLQAGATQVSCLVLAATAPA